MFQLLIQECHFSYPPKESESEWCSWAKYRSADHQFQKEKENSLRLECPDANGPGLLRADPSGEERCTLHHTVPVSPQCPQEISLLTLPVFQGAAVSSERFSQSLPPRNVTELGGSPPLRGSLEQLDRPSPAGPPLQGTELAALSTPEASLERLVPLVDYSAAWKLLPNGSRWLMHTVEQGYRDPAFQRDHSHDGGSRAGSGNGTRSEHSLRKEAIEVVPPLDKESGFYSHTSLFLEKGLRPF